MNDQIPIPAGNAKTEELEFISLEEAAAMSSGLCIPQTGCIDPDGSHPSTTTFSVAHADNESITATKIA